MIVRDQQNKQEDFKKEVENNKFLSIKSLLRNKKIIVKKSVPVSMHLNQNYSTLYPDSNLMIINQNRTQSQQKKRQRINSARSQLEQQTQKQAKNVINIKFEKYTKQAIKGKQVKIRTRMFSNFTTYENKKAYSPKKDQTQKHGFQDTITIQPIIKINKQAACQKRKHIQTNSNLHHHYMLLTKKSYRKPHASVLSATQTITDFQPIGKAIDCYNRKSSTTCGYKTLKQKFRNHSKIKQINHGKIEKQIDIKEQMQKKKSTETQSVQRNQTQNLEEQNIRQASQLAMRNDPKQQFKDLLPIRKPANRKDHFVFSMSQKPSNQPENKIELYRDFLWKINYSNGLYVVTPQTLDIGYRAYFGYGNNSIMLKSILRRRHWWHIIQTNDKNVIKDCHFVWTQLKINNIFKLQNSSQQVEHIPTNEYLKEFKFQNSRLEDMQNEVEQIKSLRSHSKIFNEVDFKNWASYYKKNLKFEQKITEQTFIKRCYLYRKKCITKQSDSNKFKIHNHLQYNYYLGNKKALFYNIKKLCQSKGINPFQYIPLTFHLSKGVDDPVYQIFLKNFEKMQQKKKTDKNFKNLWICKPGQNTNRGNGISVCLGLDDVKHRLRGRQKNGDGKPRTFILQKYIEKPFLFKSRKFDIRHYMLITCFNGNIKVYWYQDGYIRTASTIYNLKNTRDLFVHLTNDAVQKKCEGYGKYQKGNKISYQDFQKYLNTNFKKKKYDFLNKTMARMKQLALTAIQSTYSMLDPNRRQNNFQLIGLDFMLDEEFNPWLIQANTNPCLQLSCPLLQKIVPNMIQQVFRICIDPFFPPPENWVNSKKQFFGENPVLQNKFQLIFDQAIDGQAIQQILKKHEESSSNYDLILNKIQEDDEVFQNDGDQNWQQNTNN